MVPTMPKKPVQLVVLFLSWIALANGAGARTWTLRGGDERMYELNPKYTPHATHRTQTLGELEELYAQKAYEMRGPSIGGAFPDSSLSLPELIQQYMTNLYKISPELFTIGVSCVSVFCVWQMQGCHRFLQRNFVLSLYNLRAGRLWCVLTNTVSHSGIFHLLFNTMAMLSLGPRMARIVNLKVLFLGSALSSSVGFLLLGGTQRRGGAMGLSGFTMSLLAVYAKLFPKDILGVRVFGIFPVRMSASRLLELMGLWSVLGTLMAMASSQQICHSAHLGGLLFGVLYHELWKNHQWRRSTF